MTRPISAVPATARTDQDSIDLPASLRYALLPSAPTRAPITGSQHHTDRGAGIRGWGHALTLACGVGEPVRAGSIGERMTG